MQLSHAKMQLFHAKMQLFEATMQLFQANIQLFEAQKQVFYLPELPDTLCKCIHVLHPFATDPVQALAAPLLRKGTASTMRRILEYIDQ